MSLTPDQEFRRRQAWTRFWDIAAEIAARQSQRDSRYDYLLDDGLTREDLDEVDLAMREVDRAMRGLRRAMKALPDVLSAVGCSTELDDVRYRVRCLNTAWRDLKSGWRHNDPRPPGAR